MNTPVVTELFFPSPTVSALQLGSLTVRFYALCILAGIVVGVWLTARRLRARGGTTSQTLDIVTWAVPFGIVGGRLYHVITDNQLYFGPGKDPWGALRIWEGGVGIWGAVARAFRGVRGRGRPGAAPGPGAWAGGVTGSTMSSTANPRTCRGSSRSTPWTRQPARP